MTHTDPSRPKPSWPLLTLAGLAFVPAFGIVFGFLATCWGLLSSRPRALTAASLGAAGILLNFAGCGAIAYWGGGRNYGWSVARAQIINADLSLLVQQLEQQHSRTGRYPAMLAALRATALPLPSANIYDRGVGWFNGAAPYQYRVDPDGEHYVLYSVGLDGKQETGDEMYPLLPDSLRQHVGLRRP